MGVIQERQDRVAEECELAWYEAYSLAKWLAWCEFEEQFGGNSAFKFDPNSIEIYLETQRLLHG